MPVIPENYGEIAFRFRLEGDDQEMITTIGYKHADLDTATPAELIDAAVNVEAEWFENVCPAANMYTGWSYRGARYTYNAIGFDPGVGEVTRNVVGTASGETPPQNVALLVRKLSTSPGRSNRGRMYVPPFGLSEANINKNGTIPTAAVASQQVYYDAFALEVATNGIAQLVILHGDLTEPAVISSLVVDGTVATQRRRLRR